MYVYMCVDLRMLESWLIAERKDIVQYDIKSNEGEKNSELPTDQSFFNKLIEESRENTVEQVTGFCI